MKKGTKKIRRTLEPSHLAELPAAEFERLVYEFDRENVVPGNQAPQLTRAIELIRITKSRKQFTTLQQRYSLSKRKRTAPDKQIQQRLRARGAAALIGILKNPEARLLQQEIAPYAFAQIVKTISCDAFHAPSGCLMTDLVLHLQRSSTPDGNCLKLLSFAVLCHDLCKGDETLKEVMNDLANWIDRTCEGTSFNLNVIRAPLPQQQIGRIPRLAIEIAWLPLLHREFPGLTALEAYARWGIFREPISVKNEADDRHQTVTKLLTELGTQDRTRAWPIDHVEISIEPPNMEDQWEYQARGSLDVATDVWQPFPVCVRILAHTTQLGQRVCPTRQLTREDIVKIDDQNFEILIRKRGVFVGASLRNDQIDRIREALPHASIGLWSRKAFGTDEQDKLREALVDYRAEQIPRQVHELRCSSSENYIWRHVVLLFDPNLPQFKFSHESFAASHQNRTNSALT